MPYKDKETQKEYLRQYYFDNKERFKETCTRERNQKFVKEYLRTHPCVDCGNSDIRVLDFDHVRGIKLKGIAQMVSDRMSLKLIEAEILKCDIRCANCHRIVTHERRTEKGNKGDY